MGNYGVSGFFCPFQIFFLKRFQAYGNLTETIKVKQLWRQTDEQTEYDL